MKRLNMRFMNQSQTLQSDPQQQLTQRRVVHRTRGHGHGPITRLMSPSDLGQYLKPFVFLDIFDMDLRGGPVKSMSKMSRKTKGLTSSTWT